MVVVFASATGSGALDVREILAYRELKILTALLWRILNCYDHAPGFFRMLDCFMCLCDFI
jgi:hypothetical protein